jgi:aspartate aminotransferase-like enzyme
VFLSTSSAWEVMEASIRNMVERGALYCMCGAFSVSGSTWRSAAEKAEALRVGKEETHRPGDVDRQLATGKFDTVIDPQ